MKANKFPALLLFLLTSLTFQLKAHAQAQRGFAHAHGAELVDGQGKPLMLRGINLGNWV